MEEYDPSLGPLRAPSIVVDESNLVEAKRQAEMFAKLQKDLMQFIEPHVKVRLDADSELNDVDVMLASVRTIMLMLDQLDGSPQDGILKFSKHLETIKKTMKTNPEGFVANIKKEALERETCAIVALFLSQFISEIHHNQHGNELELSPDTFLPYESQYHEDNIEMSGWGEDTYRHIITTGMQKLLEENNGELELPLGQRVLKQGDKYIIVAM